VIAPSFADIFFNNCANNGILCIVMPKAEVEQLAKDAELGANARFTVDLEAQTITRPDGTTMAFEIEPHRKERLLNGLDFIGLTLQKDAAIADYEQRRKAATPWL
jgi:3-isopropylmalate/(R)-2-methylmalate dehydratase small subunit